MARKQSARLAQLRLRAIKSQQLAAQRRTPSQPIHVTKQKVVPTAIVEKVQPTVDYEAAWEQAEKHFNKGMARAFLYHMGGDSDPFTRAVYSFVKELDKQRRAGNISPSTKSKLQREKIRLEKTPKLDFSKIEAGKITYVPEYNTYYTRDNVGKLIVTSGIRGYDYLAEGIRAGGKFVSPSSLKRLPDRKIPGRITVPPKDQLIASEVSVTPSSDPNRLIVVLPSGRKGTIKSTGRVVIGKELGGGDKYTFIDGVLRKINDVDIFEEKLKPAEVEKFDKTFSLQRAKDLSARLSSQYSDVKNRLQKARDDGELESLRELQGLGGNRTPQQDAEMRRLEKRTAENYKAGGKLVGLFLANMFVRMGIGGTEFYRLLKENPQATLLALPGNLYDGVKADFKIFTSGDPMAISELGAEYYTGARVIRLAGKGFAVPVSIGKTLSPKYFSKIGTNILTPPATLRGTLSKTATGRRVKSIIASELKKIGVTAKVSAFIKKAKQFKGSGDVKIRKVKKITAKVIGNLESRTNLNKQYKRAKQNFKKSMEKKTSLTVGNDDYIKAVVFLEGFSSNIARLKSRIFLKNYKAKGGKIDKRREGEFTKAVQDDASKKLSSLPEFKELKNIARLKRSFQINLRKRGKIETAKITFRKIKVKIGKLPLVKKMASTISRLTAKGKRIKVSVKKLVKKPRKMVGLKIRKFKNKVETIKMKRAAAKFRKKSKWKQAWFGDYRYEQVKYAMEGAIRSKALNDIDTLLKKYTKSGVKVGLGKREELIRLLIKNRMNLWKKTKEYNTLNKLSKLNEKYMIEFRKKGKFESAKKLFNKSLNRIKALKTPTSAIRQRLRIKVRRIKGKFVKRARAKKYKKFVRQTIKYRQDKLASKLTFRKRIDKLLSYRIVKKSPIRKVEMKKLQDSKNIGAVNKFIDGIFRELANRQKITISTLQYSQLKNILKKRIARAIKTGNKGELRAFGDSLKKTIADMNKKSSNPDIRIIKTTGRDRRIRTIKDFESPSPKGTYREVKVGNQVMLQEVKQVKQVQRAKQVQVMKPQVQKYKIVSVQKKSISLRPLVDFGVKSLSATGAKNILISKQTFGVISNQGQLIKVIPGSAQDLKVFQSVGQAMRPKVNVASAVASAINSKTRSRVRSRLKTKQVLKKKKPVRVKFEKKKNTRKLSKAVMGYAFVIRQRNRFVRLRLPPMTISDVWDVGSHKLDHTLQRTGKVVPTGMTSEVAVTPKGVKGYYKKVSKKFRRVRIKKGKAFGLVRTIIEKRKYVGDTPSEIRQLQIARRGLPTKRNVKRKVNRRNPTKIATSRNRQPTLKRLQFTKKSLVLKRKRMINQLKTNR